MPRPLPHKRPQHLRGAAKLVLVHLGQGAVDFGQQSSPLTSSVGDARTEQDRCGNIKRHRYFLGCLEQGRGDTALDFPDGLSRNASLTGKLLKGPTLSLPVMAYVSAEKALKLHMRTSLQRGSKQVLKSRNENFAFSEMRTITSHMQ